MNLVQKIIFRALAYAGVPVKDPALSVFFGGGSTASGAVVTPDTAMGLPAVFACIRVLAESVAQIPFPVYRRLTDGAKERDSSHALHTLLSVRPNRWQTAFEFRETQMIHLNQRGNFYAYKLEGNDGVTRELIPLHPDRVTPYWVGEGVDAFPAYRYQPTQGSQIIFLQSEIHHIRFFTGADNLTGQSPITLHRETIGSGLSMVEYNARFFANDATPGGVLEVDGVLKDDQIKEFREHWEKAHKGTVNARKVAVLEAGMKFKQITIAPEDAQYIESRKLSRIDICSIFRVPPHMVGDLDRATFSNIEQQGIDFVTYSLMSWLARIEQATHRDLFTEKQARTHFVEFLVAGLLRGDLKSRYDAYAVGRQWGFLSPNDIRRMENMNPIKNGDEYLKPLNMVPIGMAGDPSGPETKKRLMSLVDSSARRALRREVQGLDRIVERQTREQGFIYELHQQFEEFYERHAAFLIDALAISAPRAGEYCQEQNTQLTRAIDAGLGSDELRAAIRIFETDGLSVLINLVMEGSGHDETE